MRRRGPRSLFILVALVMGAVAAIFALLLVVLLAPGSFGPLDDDWCFEAVRSFESAQKSPSLWPPGIQCRYTFGDGSSSTVVTVLWLPLGVPAGALAAVGASTYVAMARLGDLGPTPSGDA